jgi:hypothetical protein
MDNFDLSNPTFLTSLVIGAVILAAASGAFQMYTGEEGEGTRAIKPKAVIRDGILGAIFTAMAWTLVPDSMKHVSESLSSTVTAAASAAKPLAGGASDFDLQIGPPRF